MGATSPEHALVERVRHALKGERCTIIPVPSDVALVMRPMEPILNAGISAATDFRRRPSYGSLSAAVAAWCADPDSPGDLGARRTALKGRVAHPVSSRVAPAVGCNEASR